MTSTTPTVSERALRMLELIAKADEPPTLNELMAQLDLAKATTHRFASLLERLGFVRRTADGKRYAIGERLAASTAMDLKCRGLRRVARCQRAASEIQRCSSHH